MAQNEPPPEVRDFYLRDPAGVLRWLLQLSSTVSERGPIVHVPNGAIDFPEDVEKVNALDPPVGRIRLRRTADGLELIDSGGAVLPLASNFLKLLDTPAAYGGSSGYSVEVNIAEDGLIFVPKASTALLDKEYVMGGPLPYTTEYQLGANVVYLSRVFLASGQTMISGRFDLTAQTGANMQYRVGLYDQASPLDPAGTPNNKLAESLLTSSAFIGVKNVPYVTSYTVTTDGYYWNALVRSSNAGIKRVAAAPAPPLTSAPFRFVGGPGGGALPATITPPFVVTKIPIPFVSTRA